MRVIIGAYFHLSLKRQEVILQDLQNASAQGGAMWYVSVTGKGIDASYDADAW